ncbi:MAG: DUF4097 family beta strand repeat protein [Eubacterium sp.]|nr:DUF4097 family beta strand repeat protein [Eubacterium sp.]
MEELREYLNSLFDGVKDTPDTLRAKAELLQMMEDKYDGLISDGMSDEAARKTVIDEFGDFDEIAKELGVEEIITAHASMSSERAAGNNNVAAGGGIGYGYTGPGQQTATGQAMGGPNKQQFGPETEANRQTGEYDTKYKSKYRHFYAWNSTHLNTYISFTKRHAFLVAAAVALCILAPFTASMIDELFDHISAGDLGGALSGIGFFSCIAVAIAFFIMASRMTSRYGGINKDAVALDMNAQGDLNHTIEKMESARTAQLVIGIILCVLAPGSSPLFQLLPGVLGDMLSASVLLFAAVGVFFIIYSTSTGNRLKELSKSLKKYEKNRGNIPEQTEPSSATAKWEYQPKFGMPIVLIIVIVIVSAMILKVGISIFMGKGIWGGSFWGITSGKDYDGENKFPASGPKSVSISLSSGDVRVEQIDGSEIICSYHGKFSSRPEIAYNSGNSKITIKQENSFSLFNWGKNDGVVTVKIPKGTKLSYDIDLSAGDTSITGADIDRLIVDQSAGDFTMNDTTVTGNTEFDMSAGNINIHGSSFEGKTELDMSAGDAVFDNSSVKDLVGDMSAGDFRFTFGNKDDAKKYTFELDTSAGDVYYMGSNFDDDVTIAATDTSDPHRIELDTSAGDIKIE